MRGLYIDNIDKTRFPELIGVKKKINGQINAFKELGVQMEYIYVDECKIIKNGIDTNINTNKYKSSLANTNVFFNSIIKFNIIEPENYDFVYIRFTIASYYLANLIEYFYKHNVKVFLEIPTYPYKNEMNGLKDKVLSIIDDLVWIKIRKYVYRVVLTNNLDGIKNIESINIFNGIDVNSLKVKQETLELKKSINLIAVAQINRWHGYDRLIKGLYDYYQNDVKEQVEIFIVGDGAEKNNLINLTKNLMLEDKVHFMGLKYGDELNEIYSKMDIGVSSLALFRAGGGHDPIKSKEYIGKGLPVLLAYNDRALDEKLPFIFKSKEDESNINIQELLEKYKNMNIDTNSIRSYAEEHLSWKTQMKKVLNSIKLVGETDDRK